MRIFTVIIFLFFLSLILVRWWHDIVHDQSFTITTNKRAEAYNDCQCTSAKDKDCKVMFDAKPNIAYDVQRIRNGQHFMSVKVVHDGVEGWLIYDRNTMLLRKKR